MSALPKESQHPNPVHPALQAIVDRPDDALLTDDEVWELQGGSSFFMTKCLFGLGAVAAYLIATRRIDQVRNFDIRFSTFVVSNLIFIGTTFACQKFYDRSNNQARLAMHNSALQLRKRLNDAYMDEIRKAPKFH